MQRFLCRAFVNEFEISNSYTNTRNACIDISYLTWSLKNSFHKMVANEKYKRLPFTWLYKINSRVFNQWSQVGWMLAHHRDGLSSSTFCLIRDSSVGLWVGIQSAGDLVSQTSQLLILHSAEEDNVSPFDWKIACLCQGIKINNKKHAMKA